jgi:hypothetical protein
MTKQTLSTLELNENPTNKITWVRRHAHYGFCGPVPGLRRGERVFAVGAAHHDAHIVLIESDERPTKSALDS